MQRSLPLLLNILASALPLATMPLITRIYDPLLYGAYLTLLSVTTLVSFLGSLRLDLAIIASQTADRAVTLAQIVAATVTISVAIWTGTTSVVPALASFAPGSLSGSTLLDLLFAALLGMQLIGQSMLIRNGQTSAIALVNIVLQALFPAFAVAFVISAPQGNGLIAARAVALIVAILLLARLLVPMLAAVGKNVVGAGWRSALSESRPFLLYTYPYSIIGTFSRDALIYLLLLSDQLTVVGAVGLARSLLQAPGAILSTALSALFFRRLMQDEVGTDSTRAGQAAARVLCWTTFPLFGLVAATADHWVPLVLGEKWRNSHVFFQLLAYPYALTILTGWPERIFEARGRQRLSLTIQLATDGAILAVLIGITTLGKVGPLTLTAAYGAAYTVYQVVYAVTCFSLLAMPMGKVALLLVKTALLFCGGWALGTALEAAFASNVQIVLALMTVVVIVVGTALHPTIRALAALQPTRELNRPS